MALSYLTNVQIALGRKAASMQILLIHQHFPGQFRELGPGWLGQGHRLTAFGCTPISQLMAQPDLEARWAGLRYFSYPAPGGDAQDGHLLRAVAVAQLGEELIAREDYQPDVVMVHSGWGEALPLRRLWPKSQLLVLPELWGQPVSLGEGVEPSRGPLSPQERCGLHQQNLLAAAALAECDVAVTATAFQRSTFTVRLQHVIQVLPEGIAAEALGPDPSQTLLLPDGQVISAGEPLITFASRQLEPLRGLRTMIQALPSLFAADPAVQLVMVGDTGPGYGPPSSHPEGHLAEALALLPTSFDRSRLHWLGPLPHAAFLQLLQVSAAHVHLSYPYTLSWSLLEAMACGTPLVGSLGGAIGEVLEHRRTGLLVNFNAPGELAAALLTLLRDRAMARQLGAAARAEAIQRHGLATALAGYNTLFRLHHSTPNAPAAITAQARC